MLKHPTNGGERNGLLRVFRAGMRGCLLWAASALAGELTPVPSPGPAPLGPPPAFPSTRSTFNANPPRAFAATAEYSIGEPTEEEQWYLELINRARANPAAEAERLRQTTDPDVRASYQAFQVDLELMVQQISAIPPAPPLAMNARLLAAARLHSGDMFTNAFQDHQGSQGSTPPQRMMAQGYLPAWIGENVNAGAQSVEHGHAAFEVDFGFDHGMQNPPGHRNNIHHPVFREVGIGVVRGRNGSVGPQLVTQDFGIRVGATPLVTGVVYSDVNGNRFYDPGEGIGGMRVEVEGANDFALTSGSGGYAVPIPQPGRYGLRFALNGETLHVETVTVATNNVKVDYVPPYSPPVIQGPNPAVVGQANEYQFSPVSGATAYQWDHRKRVSVQWIEGAETGLAGVDCEVSPGSAVVASQAVASGTASFHLVHALPENQCLTLRRDLRIGPLSQLSFASRLGWATTGQVARAQISTNGGESWTELWHRAGNGSYGQFQFERVTLSLAAWAGQELRVRFRYDYVSGTYFPQSSLGVGFYVDDITVATAEELIEPEVSDLVETQFAFIPDDATNYCLRVRAQVGDRFLQWGPSHAISAWIEAAMRLQLLGPPVLFGGRVQLEFVVLAGAPTSFQVESASDPTGPWIVDPTATVELPTQEAPHRAFVLPCGPHGFYRIVAR